MVTMLEERVKDRPFVRLIQKWMKAGVLEEDGKVIHPATGTPQGGIISPVLSNIYLHYVLMRKVAQKLRGYWNYYGVIGNIKSLTVLNRACTKLLFKWLNRRSQRRSYNWAGFNKMCEHFRMPAPRIVETIKRQQEFRWTASAR